jgi:hypothetical protein
VDVHCEHNSSRQEKSGKSWSRTSPKCKDAFLFIDGPSTSETVAIVCSGIYRLHPSLDGILTGQMERE